MIPVSLKSVVNEMDVLSDEMTAYINKQTGELFTVGEEEAGLVEAGHEDDAFIPAWQKEILPKVREVLVRRLCAIAGQIRDSRIFDYRAVLPLFSRRSITG